MHLNLGVVSFLAEKRYVVHQCMCAQGNVNMRYRT